MADLPTIPLIRSWPTRCRARSSRCSTRSARPRSRSCSSRSRPTTACTRPLDLPPGLRVRGRAEAPPDSAARAQRDLRATISASSAPAAGSTMCRRCVDEIVGALRVPDQRLGLAAVRPRPQPGLVRVCEPARRAGRHGCGRRCRSTRWGCAAGHAIRMAARLTGRARCCAAASLDPERLSVIRSYCEPPEMPGHIDVVDGRRRPADRPARPGRPRGQALRPHRRGLLREPVLPRRDRGATAPRSPSSPTAPAARSSSSAPTRSRSACSQPPADYGADIVVGPTQPLGVHMNCGGGVGGYIASRDEERFVREYNALCISITGTPSPASSASASRCVAPDLLRHARARQGLDRQLGLSLGHRQRGLPGAARAPRACARSAS